MVWGTHQKNLKSDIEMCKEEQQDISSTISAAHKMPLPSSPDSSCKRMKRGGGRADKVSMMYKVMNNLVDVAPTPGTPQPSNRTTRGVGS